MKKRIITSYLKNRVSNKVSEKGGFVEDWTFDPQGRITINCGKGHYWPAKPHNLLSLDRWCPYCWGRKSWIGFEKRLAEVIHSKGGVLLSPYKNATSYVRIQCGAGHEWNATPSSIEGMNSWCPYCYGVKCDKPGGFEKRLRDIIESKGGVLLQEYTNNWTKVLIRCSQLHEWKVRPGHITESDSWCPICSKLHNLKREPLCNKILSDLTGGLFIKGRQEWIHSPSSDRTLELDGFCKELNLAFEHQGPHHYKIVPFPGQNLQKIQLHDKVKAERCEKCGVDLIVVPYHIPIKKLKNFIAEELTKIGNKRNCNLFVTIPPQNQPSSVQTVLLPPPGLHTNNL
jgi:hypothetical protein